MIVGRISKLPYVGKPKEQLRKEYEIFTEIPAKEAELVPEVAPLWIYVISAVAGVVMLLLLIWILSKVKYLFRSITDTVRWKWSSKWFILRSHCILQNAKCL